METSILVNRMLSSLSRDSNSTLDSYLKVFGVTTTFNELPLVFDPQYSKQWKAFLLDRKYSTKNIKLRTILTILDFIRFMRSQRINPFINISLNAKIRPIDIAKTFLLQEVKGDYTAIATYLRKTGILSYLKVDRRVMQVALDKHSINLNFSLLPLRKGDTIEKIVNSDLRGYLYRSTLPIQLQPLKGNPIFTTAISTLATSTSYWLPLTTIGSIRIFCRVAKDCFVVRAVLPVNIDLVRSTKDMQYLLNLWKSVKL